MGLINKKNIKGIFEIPSEIDFDLDTYGVIPISYELYVYIENNLPHKIFHLESQFEEDDIFIMNAESLKQIEKYVKKQKS